MKKIFTGLLLCMLTGSAFAQYRPEPNYGFRLGLTASPTIGWAKPETGTSNGINLGFSYGLLADFNFAENYSFSTGLTITTINGKTTELNPSPYYAESGGTGTATPFDLKYMLQYVEIPLTVKLKTDKIGLMRWYGQFGLSNDFNIGARQDVQLDGRSFRKDISIKKDINFYRAGLIIGGGVEYDIAGSTSLMAGLTFNNGFTDISDDKNRSVRNHYIGISLGVFF
ncbi:porin family protein [Pedobacter sp. AW31-3R]|uniref:porin family protein n=1 Tax=Pedobacter sp. AW31-3R TaxID=3445781 RepID=UPI003F9F6F36